MEFVQNIQNIVSAVRRTFNPEARDHAEVLSLRGNESPEANDRILELIRNNRAKGDAAPAAIPF